MSKKQAKNMSKKRQKPQKVGFEHTALATQPEGSSTRGNSTRGLVRHIDKRTPPIILEREMDFREWLARTHGMPTEAPSTSFYNDNMFYDYAPASPPPTAPVADLNVDPTLAMSDVATNNSSTRRSTITVPGHLAETGREILISLVNALDSSNASNINQQQAGEPKSTETESEGSEDIPELNHDPSLPKTIDDIRVVSAPHADQIAQVIDSKRGGTKRHMFYLAKTTEENYYWFCSPRTDRDLVLNKLIGDYKYKLIVKRGSKKMRVVKRFRNGTTVYD